MINHKLYDKLIRATFIAFYYIKDPILLRNGLLLIEQYDYGKFTYEFEKDVKNYILRCNTLKKWRSKKK